MFLYNISLVSISVSVSKSEKINKKSQGAMNCPKELETEQWNFFNYDDRWITRVISTITDTKVRGKISPSHLLNENGDLSFLLYFSKQCLVENI